MKNLKVFLFNQNWFHLASLIESLNAHEKEFSRIEVYFINHKLAVKPLELHFSFPGDKFFGLKPEQVMSKYLYKRYEKSRINFSFKNPSLEKVSHKNSIFIDQLDFHSLKLTYWRKTQIGMAILSFLISLSRDSEPKLFKYRKLIHNLEITYAQIFNFMDSLSLSRKSDEIWVCNGRLFHDRAIVEYAKKEKISTKFFEIGGEGTNQDRWILHNDSPHDRVKHQKSIRAHYKLVKPVKKTIKSWYESQKPGGSNSYSANFHDDKNLSSSENIFVYFSSSDDEVSAISMDWDSWWGSQISAVDFMIKYFEQRPELNLIIRVHPNQKNKSKDDKNKWDSLQTNSPNVKVYSYDSKVNSYQIMSAARGVITFGSTIGTEAAYLRKPGALMSKARWDLLIPHKYIKNKLDFDRWIEKVLNNDPSIELGVQKSYLGSLMWGHYMKTAGSHWRIVERRQDFRGINVGYLGGIPLKPFLLFIFASRISRLIRLKVVETKFKL